MRRERGFEESSPRQLLQVTLQAAKTRHPLIMIEKKRERGGQSEKRRARVSGDSQSHRETESERERQEESHESPEVNHKIMPSISADGRRKREEERRGRGKSRRKRRRRQRLRVQRQIHCISLSSLISDHSDHVAMILLLTWLFPSHPLSLSFNMHLCHCVAERLTIAFLAKQGQRKGARNRITSRVGDREEEPTREERWRNSGECVQ